MDTVFIVTIDFIAKDDTYTYTGGIYATKEKAIKAVNEWGSNLSTFNLIANRDYEEVDKFFIEYRGTLNDEEIIVTIDKYIVNKEIPDSF